MNAASFPVVRKVCFFKGAKNSLEGVTPPNSYAEYVILDGICVFTGITLGTRSTINGEEEIIAAICQLEKIVPTSLRFFDLQTSRGYNKLSETFSCGYDYDEITFTWTPNEDLIKGISDVDWVPTECPEIIQQIFARYIRS